jgi:F-type H+-transporting ATPase subunit gamma
MDTLETLTRRIGTAGALRDLVRTMKSLSAAGVRQHEHALTALLEYERTVDLGLRALLREGPPPSAPPRRRAGPTGILVVGSDQGFCGAFNDQVVDRLLEDQPAGSPSPDGFRLYAVGARAAARLRDAGFDPDGQAVLPTSASAVAPLVQELVLVIDGWHADGDLDRVVVYHNAPVSTAVCRPHRQALLPVALDRWTGLSRQPWPTQMLPLHTADRPGLIRSLLGQHLVVSLHRCLALSLVSEHASRLVAMQAAERNIDERLDDLRGRANELRQTSITTELLDIVAGAEAVSA